MSRMDHQAHKAALYELGRPLNRRAKSRCELCGESTSLFIVEVPPLLGEPDPDRAAFVCDRCRSLAEGGGHVSHDLRFLEKAVWSDVVPVQILAVRMTRRLAEQGPGWPRETLEGLWLAPEVEELV